jgi:bifunctional non-homologous end joining protein LigD
MSLKDYRKKRDFKLTPEPRSGRGRSQHAPLYLIQKHAASHLHYDLRLELGGTLKSWAIPKGPSLDPSVKRLAVHVEDHPLAYGTFEGVIPANQYGGGIVMLWDTGTWEGGSADAKTAYQKGHLRFVIHGKKLKGAWNLVQLKHSPKNWLLIKVDDKYAQTCDDDNFLEKHPRSVLSRRTLAGIEKHAKKAS